MDKFVGKRLDGRYEIREIIGIGGMAVVYKAHDIIEDRTVAIKILKEEFTSNEEFLRRFKNESKAIAMLSHPNIVKVYDVSFGDLIQYIVMEYIEGITLKEYIERQGSLRWRDAVHFASQILKGLQHAHDKGIVHRDVKPQNIMVLPDQTIKVTDFGIARFARSEQRTITDKAIGSVHYISPEQARGERTDEKTDLYSVGVILYEMLTGRVPFQAESAVSVAIMQLQRDPKLPSEINPSVPLGLEQITLHAMQKSVERRYQSAAEMLCDLDAFRKDPDKVFHYAAFVDDSPTRFVDPELGLNPTPEEIEEPETQEEEEITEKNNVIPILAGVAATLVVAVIVILAIFLPKILGKTGSSNPCPDFSGMTWEEIQKSDAYKTYKIIRKFDDSAMPANEVYDQEPKKGKNIKKGATITVYISTGGETTTVPDLTGLNASQAKPELQRSDLEFEEDPEGMYSDDVPAGLFVASDPAVGETVPKYTKITVYFSNGPEPVIVPDAVGHSKEDARSILEKEGFKVVFKENSDLSPKNDYKEKGWAFKQSPAADKKVDPGSTVTVYLSSGVTKFDSISLALPAEVDGTIPPKITDIGVSVDSGRAYLTGKPTCSFDKNGMLFRVNNLVFKYDGDSNSDYGKSNETVDMSLSATVDGFHEVVFEFTLNVKTGKIVGEVLQTYPLFGSYEATDE